MEKKRSTSLRLSSSPLIARDISESLGKLPPQALDLEEAVLGALMLEKPALDQVKSYLKPDHFYREPHKIIYEAILAVDADANPVDMRTVVFKLRENGKIEMVGGAYYIAELTSKVSSAANIDYHCRVIVEMAIKREMITIASQIHHDAYEDGTDPFDLLDKVATHFEFFKKHTIPDNEEARIKALWEKTLITEEPTEEPPLICIDDTPIVSPQNHTLIVGKKKSRKTLFIAWIISKYLKDHPNAANKVLLFDTEQGKSHVYKIRKKIHQLTGLWVPIFFLRGMAPADRRDFIATTCKHWSSRPTIAVVDGIRDCMSNINDPDEATEVVVWLEKMTLDFNIGVINVLHLNKTDENPRGHIGTELLNKAICTIQMDLDDKNGCTIVKCESARDKPFDTFAFTHDSNELPMIVGTPISGTIVPMDEKKRRLEDIFTDGPLRYAQLVQEITEHFDVRTAKAKSMIIDLQRNGLIIKSGPKRSPDTVYKLIISGTNNYQEPKVVQTNMNLQPAVLAMPPDEKNDDLPF